MGRLFRAPVHPVHQVLTPTEVMRTVFPLRLLDSYRREAESYDRRTAVFHRWRRRLVDLLPLRSGDVVLDVGCGSGLCFPLLQARIGPGGRIVGIDQSPQMLATARSRIKTEGWANVTL